MFFIRGKRGPETPGADVRSNNRAPGPGRSMMRLENHPCAQGGLFVVLFFVLIVVRLVVFDWLPFVFFRLALFLQELLP